MQKLQIRWIALFAAMLIALYLCWLMLQPFIEVLLWAVVLVIVFYPVHRRILARTGSPAQGRTLPASQTAHPRAHGQPGLERAAIVPTRHRYDSCSAHARHAGGRQRGFRRRAEPTGQRQTITRSQLTSDGSHNRLARTLR
jgi:hypothetical protein